MMRTTLTILLIVGMVLCLSMMCVGSWFFTYARTRPDHRRCDYKIGIGVMLGSAAVFGLHVWKFIQLMES